MRSINCFIPIVSKTQVQNTINGLKKSAMVDKIYLLATDEPLEMVEGCEFLRISSLNTSDAIHEIAKHATARYTLLYTKHTTLELGYFCY